MDTGCSEVLSTMLVTQNYNLIVTVGVACVLSFFSWRAEGSQDRLARWETNGSLLYTTEGSSHCSFVTCVVTS